MSASKPLTFDDIGNRKNTAAGGDADGANLRGATYTANRLNQYSSRTVPAYVDILGIANPTAGVTVNGNTAQYRRGEYFHHAVNVPNSTAQYPTVTVVSQYGGGQTENGKVYVPPATESFTHDADGNLTSDGRWTYSWDAENRLVQMIRDTDNPSGARQKLVFEYDHQGRRIRKQFSTYNGGWQEQTDTIFLYDGWNLVAELNANASNAKVRTYVWGTDLSGTMQGAGGVGGLLKVAYYGGTTTNAFVAYDGNANVMALVDASNGNTCARYEYGPFAEAIRVSGPMGKLNPIRFSTKYTDNESGFLYYGYRYYNPSTGRWLSRDPAIENASQRTSALAWLPDGVVPGVSEFGFVGNNPTLAAEYLGAGFWCYCPGISVPHQVALGPRLTVDNAPGISDPEGTDVGVHICTEANQGQLVRIAWLIACNYRWYAPRICGCHKQECNVTSTYRCSMASATPKRPARPSWIWFKAQITKDCRLYSR